MKDIADADNPQTPIWEATQINQFGQITEATLGNGVITGYDFDPNTGELNAIESGKTGVNDIQDLSYQWDDLGNLSSRTNHDINKTETFQYDGLNRLHKAHLDGAQKLQMDYAANGNITRKTKTPTDDDFGGTYYKSPEYTYVQLNNLDTHKVKTVKVWEEEIETWTTKTLTYDARGNMKSGMGRNITYSSYNKPISIIEGGDQS